MHVDHEIVDYVAAEEQDYEEIVEEYEEEVLVQEGVLEPLTTDFVAAPPAQGKPRCITLILQITIYIVVVHLRYRNFMEPTCIYIYISTYESY
jgi:hypothetical protein